MIEIIFLGTSASVAGSKRDNTSLLITDGTEKFLIDCSGSPVYKLANIRQNFKLINKIIFTHTHPDHVYGLPSLIHSQYRVRNQVTIWGSSITVKFLKKLLSTHKLIDKKKFPEICLQRVSGARNETLFDSEKIKISCFSVHHAPESIGLKFIFKQIGKTVVYSGDTAPAETLIEAAKNADCLIHDCLSPEKFFIQYPILRTEHTSSLDLGRIAKVAQVKNLIPIHLTVEVKYSKQELINEIRKNYRGKITFVEDFSRIYLR
ncbi:MAG: MBL fold metallo-hydrolase [Elusimicrobiota bacterium]|nr:MBL fold metallo-hydrolase [Elusimicrobiota bacterium]